MTAQVSIHLFDQDGVLISRSLMPDMAHAEAGALAKLGDMYGDDRIIATAKFYTGDESKWVFDSEMEY